VGISDVELFATLHRKLWEAEDAYKRAVEGYNRLMADSVPIADVDDPGFLDRTHALRHAMVVQRLALRRYDAALKEFTDFAVRGKQKKTKPNTTGTKGQQ